MIMTMLFVGNLSPDVTQVDLFAGLAAHGQVGAADIVIERSSDTSRGVGFFEMTSHEGAMAAIQGLGGTDLKGRSINVSRARSRTERSGRGNPPRGLAGIGDARHRW
jgi:RNA recognition motif-containing protein